MMLLPESPASFQGSASGGSGYKRGGGKRRKSEGQDIEMETDDQPTTPAAASSGAMALTQGSEVQEGKGKDKDKKKSAAVAKARGQGQWTDQEWQDWMKGGWAKGCGKQRGKKGAQMDGGMKEFYILLAKSMLQQQHNMRLVMGACFDVLILPADSDEVKGMESQGRAYNHAAQTEGYQEARAPPHVYVFAGLMDALKNRGAAVGQKNQEAISGYLTMCAAMSVYDRAEAVQVCKLDKTWKADTKKVVMSFEKTGIRREVISAMTQVGASHKQGRAPASGQEREMQTWLESFLG